MNNTNTSILNQKKPGFHFTSNAAIAVDLENVSSNYIYIQQYTKKHIMAVIKADAYGVGLEAIFNTLYKRGCRMFAIAYLDELKALIQISKKNPLSEKTDILLLSEHPKNIILNSTLLKTAYRNNLNPIACIYDIKHLKTLHTNQQPQYAIYFDTGFNRLGIDFKIAKKVSLLIEKYRLAKPKFILSHFANADADKINTKLFEHVIVQYDRFMQISKFFPQALKSIANSSGLLLSSKYHLDFTRPGKALYGLVQNSNISNVVALYAKILQIYEIQQGQSVGYHQTFIAPINMKIATISAGYADGIPLQLSYSNTCNKKNQYQHQCCIILDDKKYFAKIIGRISMDTFTIDITHINHKLSIGQTVEILGPNTIHIEQLAREINSNVHCILLNLGARVKKLSQSNQEHV